MENLVIRLGSTTEDPVHWLVWSSHEQEIIASGVLDNAEQLASLSERAGKRPITALVPGCDVLLKWVTLPAKASRKALTAIPFMLEEDLSSDISDHFFALGERKAEQQAVAVVNHDKMQNWLSAIRAANLNCDKMLPDVLAMPFQENTWSFVALGQQAIVRQDQWQGLQGDMNWVLPAIEHFAKQQPLALEVANYSSENLASLANITPLEQQLDMPMLLLAKGALQSPFNLLQGTYKTKTNNNGKWRQWRAAAVLAIVALLVTFVDKSIELHRLEKQSDDLTTQMHAEFKRAFPNLNRPINIRRVMETNMARLESGGGSASMLAIMAQLANAFASSDVKPQTIRFDSARSELRMQAVASKFEQLELFKRLAEEQGFEVQQGAINSKDDQVIGSLTIRS